MAIKKYNIEVVRTFQYEIEIDDSIWTKEQIQEKFFIDDVENSEEELAKQLSEALTDHVGYSNNMEFFGFVKQNLSSEGELFPVNRQHAILELNAVEESLFTKGLSVNIISQCDQIESEVLQLSNKRQ